MDMLAAYNQESVLLSRCLQAYGRELSEAYEWLSKFRVSRKEAELHQAWDLYYHVFKRINKQLHSMTTLELQYVAPALVGFMAQCVYDCVQPLPTAIMQQGCACTVPRVCIQQADAS